MSSSARGIIPVRYYTLIPIHSTKPVLSYNFQVPNQAGTYWYHSHLSTQYCDGLRYVNQLHSHKYN